MKTLKSIQSALLIIAIAVLAGCSDQITSSGDNLQSNFKQGYKSEIDKQTAVPLFHTQIRLKPFRSYTFNYYNTGLVKIHSVNFTNLSVVQSTVTADDQCGDLGVFSSESKKGSTELNCKSSGLDLREITVENKGSSFLDVDAILFGEKRIEIPAIE